MENQAINISKQRLIEERKLWRKDHPHGFVARPIMKEDGTADLYRWRASIPGKPNTPWDKGIFKLNIEFSEDYPNKPPKCKFTPVLFHPNVYPSGTVCLSILNEDEDWKPTLTLKTILLGIQDLLDNPNINSPAQAEPYILFTNNKEQYNQRIIQIAKESAKSSKV